MCQLNLAIQHSPLEFSWGNCYHCLHFQWQHIDAKESSLIKIVFASSDLKYHSPWTVISSPHTVLIKLFAFYRNSCKSFKMYPLIFFFFFWELWFTGPSLKIYLFKIYPAFFCPSISGQYLPSFHPHTWYGINISFRFSTRTHIYSILNILHFHCRIKYTAQ